MEGNHCGLFRVVSQHLHGGPEETHDKLTVIVTELQNREQEPSHCFAAFGGSWEAITCPTFTTAQVCRIIRSQNTPWVTVCPSFI
jgi:hypothetical protein